jgi:hypothetical protein
MHPPHLDPDISVLPSGNVVMLLPNSRNVRTHLDWDV